MNVKEQRFLEEMEQARIRETQPGDAHEEQILMASLGVELRIHRQNRGLSLSQLSALISIPDSGIFATEEDLTLAEQGLIEPEFFFEILPQWSTLVKFDAAYFIAQMNK